MFFMYRSFQLKKADQYYIQGDYQGAYDIYKIFSRGMAGLIEEEHPMAVLPKGADVTFGSYEQDGDEENGQEPIEWTILTKENNTVLLFSKKILECRRFGSSKSDTWWLSSELHDWLNDSFYNAAFSEQERERIKRYDSKTKPYKMNTLEDPVFIMELISMENIYGVSYKTVEDVQRPHGSLQGIPTEYVEKTYPSNYGRWWVEGGFENGRGLLIKGDGSLGDGDCTDNNVGVRPMIWVEQ